MSVSLVKSALIALAMGTCPPVAPPSPAPAPAAIVICTQEDGSDSGQSFPCRWDAAVQGNGTGDSYWIDGPDAAPRYDVPPVEPTEPTEPHC